MEKCIRFLVNAAKYTLAKREDACMNGLRRTKGIYSFHELKLRPFLNTPIRPGIIHSWTKLSLEAIHLRPHPNNINADSRIEMVQIVRLSKSTLSSDEDLHCDIKLTIVRQTIN